MQVWTPVALLCSPSEKTLGKGMNSLILPAIMTRLHKKIHIRNSGWQSASYKFEHQSHCYVHLRTSWSTRLYNCLTFTCFSERRICTQSNPSTVKVIPWYLQPDAPVIYTGAFLIWQLGRVGGQYVTEIAVGDQLHASSNSSRTVTFTFGKTLGKGYEPPYPASYRLDTTTTVVLDGWIWH